MRVAVSMCITSKCISIRLIQYLLNGILHFRSMETGSNPSSWTFVKNNWRTFTASAILTEDSCNINSHMKHLRWKVVPNNRSFKSSRQPAIHRRLKSVSSPATFCRILKEKKTQSKCMFRLGDDDIESPYKNFLDTFDFLV